MPGEKNSQQVSLPPPRDRRGARCVCPEEPARRRRYQEERRASGTLASQSAAGLLIAGPGAAGGAPFPRETLLPEPIITLTTDYGTDDHLVGTLKGVILKINLDTKIVDINHHVAPFDVLDGALSIGAAYRYFPPRTVHLVVVDPGVGTQRRPILASGDQHYFVAPDNGVLSLVYERVSTLNVRHITADHYFLSPISNTFHGRDIFAPVAAWLAKTGQASSFGEEVSDFARFSLPKPKASDNTVKG